jgi:alpha-L-fucosidase
MKRRNLLGAAGLLPMLLAKQPLRAAEQLTREPGTEPMAAGPFSADWNSLEHYATPAWYGDAKFGIWAHWGPQCQAEFGDWYARKMYDEGSKQYADHLKKYGHPSQAGFKEVIRDWKAERWDPDALLALYKRAGAQYFVALANHHDNFDTYDSAWQPWNATRVGPRKDLIGGWAKAARKQGMRFGVSVHASHAWTWLETAQRADRQGPLQGVPYDGKLRADQGKGTWWEGLDPQDLYAQNHALSRGSDAINSIHSEWDWGNGASQPDQAYCRKFYNRTVDLINKYDPDLVYFDDTALPLWPASTVGLKIAAHYYNKSVAKNGKVDVVINGKILDEQQRKCMVWDIERGQSNQIEPRPWQTDTCIGDWHYNREVYDQHRYKSAQTVIHTLADVVSKNGNLLLSVPVRGDGTIDSDEVAVVEGIAAWMASNAESIFGTRPWKVFGEGPAQENAAPMRAQGFNEGKGKPFGPADIRFTTKGATLYAIVLGWPQDGKVVVRSLAAGNPLRPEAIASVHLCGGGPLPFTRTAQGLEVVLPREKPATHYAFALRIA